MMMKHGAVRGGGELIRYHQSEIVADDAGLGRQLASESIRDTANVQPTIS